MIINMRKESTEKCIGSVKVGESTFIHFVPQSEGVKALIINTETRNVDERVFEYDTLYSVIADSTLNLGKYDAIRIYSEYSHLKAPYGGEYLVIALFEP